MPSLRQEKFAKLIKELIAQFILHEGSGKSLITITNCTISKDLKRATVFITVLPEKLEQEALAFLQRKSYAARGFLKEHIKAKTLPSVEFELDMGEKNRQRIDELSSTS